MNNIYMLTLLILSMFLSGCVGYSRVLIATKTNVGLDIESTPPTSEITIARRELAIQPTFPGVISSEGETLEQALPLLASFGLEGNFLNPSITGYFAGGDAAVHLAQVKINEKDKNEMCLKNIPDTRAPIVKFWDWITFKTDKKIEIKKKNRLRDTKPFYFATDTMYGAKIAWSGTGGPYPDTLKLGYNRKEFSSPPIMMNEECKEGQNCCLKIPSFIASIDNASAFEMHKKSGVRHVQFFATGKAATEFSRRDSVRQAAFEKMAPEAAKIDASVFNQGVFNEIKGEMGKANNAQITRIVDEAIKRKLVPGDTDRTEGKQFLIALEKAIETPSHSISLQLLYLLKALTLNPK